MLRKDVKLILFFILRLNDFFRPRIKIYRDGKQGRIYGKRFQVGGVTRDKEYALTIGTPGTKVLYFARHDTEDESNAQKLLIHLQPKPRLRNLVIEYNFGELAIKGRDSKGNTITENSVEKIIRNREGAGE